MKRLIVCNDGTWNTPEQEDNGIPAPTNVFKLSNSIVPVDGGKVEQIVYYHPGVGTEGFVDSVKGGAFGIGADDQIQSAYHWLGKNYVEGDEIFIYGFSRGAFIARSLAGFLGRGLLDLRHLGSGEEWKRVAAAYSQGYRKIAKAPDDHRTWAVDWKFFHGRDAAPVRFIGVWDTVGALGIPDDLALLNLFDHPERWKFHDTKLGKHIQTARHAMAIDEIRASFTVTRWSNIDDTRDVKEIWFPGVHSDVGGGYSESGLSNGSLLWMLGESVAAGLTFRPGVAASIIPNPLGPLHNSYKGAFAKLRSRPRAIARLIAGNTVDYHDSALQRYAASPISYPPYHQTISLAEGESIRVEIFADRPWNSTEVYLEAGGEYVFAAEGEWLDNRDAIDWKGFQKTSLKIGDIVRAGLSVAGKAENLWKKDESAVDLLGTKRVESLKWFSMVGAIGNDGNKVGQDTSEPSNDGSPCSHQYVNLSQFVTGSPLRVESPGYLYAFANDAWGFYHNNHGSIYLTITRL